MYMFQVSLDGVSLPQLSFTALHYIYHPLGKIGKGVMAQSYNLALTPEDLQSVIYLERKRMSRLYRFPFAVREEVPSFRLAMDFTCLYRMPLQHLLQAQENWLFKEEVFNPFTQRKILKIK